MPANRHKGKSLSYRAYRAARAAYSMGIQEFDGRIHAWWAASIALSKFQIHPVTPLHDLIMEKVQQSLRPAAQRVIDNREACMEEF